MVLRRGLAVLVLCALLPQALSADDAVVAAATPDTQTAPAAADTPGTLPVIAFVGDSLAGDYCRGMRRVLSDLPDPKVLCWAHPSSGLTRIDAFDWTGTLAGYLADETPDIAFVGMGANDAQRIVLDDAVLDFGEEPWAEVYGQRVDAFIDQLAAAGTTIVWVGLPTASSGKYGAKLGWMNEIYAARAAAKGVAYFPLWDRTSDAEGTYLSTLTDKAGEEHSARQSDGVHFSADGELLVACMLLDHVPDGAAIRAGSRYC
jgi:hypothetical protein